MLSEIETRKSIPTTNTLLIKQTLNPLIARIVTHPLLLSIKSVKALTVFSEHHVFAVWDFMSLLKKLQRELSCIDVPWLPVRNGLGCHLINRMVAEEESDITAHGNYSSHFEIYLDAMHSCGGNTETINQFIGKLKNGVSVADALITTPGVPDISRRFVQSTFQILNRPAHHLAAALVFGRESITYKMFIPILQGLPETDEIKIKKFHYYFSRHVELDASSHEAMGYQLLEDLCGQNQQKWQEAEETASYALNARLELLDGIYQIIMS